MKQQWKLNYEEIEKLLASINYDKKGWKMRLIEKQDGFLLQWTFMERDLTNPDSQIEEEQFARKWYISPYMTDSEIVRTAYLAVQQAEMHEVAERFTYCGSRIFDPHMNYTELAVHTGEIGVDNRIPRWQGGA